MACYDLFSANQVITEAIQSQTEMGKMAKEILLRGESISEELAVKLVTEKINSPEVAHHGMLASFTEYPLSLRSLF